MHRLHAAHVTKTSGVGFVHLSLGVHGSSRRSGWVGRASRADGLNTGARTAQHPGDDQPPVSQRTRRRACADPVPACTVWRTTRDHPGTPAAQDFSNTLPTSPPNSSSPRASASSNSLTPRRRHRSNRRDITIIRRNPATRRLSRDVRTRLATGMCASLVITPRSLSWSSLAGQRRH